jgi:hypothetical protein
MWAMLNIEPLQILSVTVTTLQDGLMATIQISATLLCITWSYLTIAAIKTAQEILLYALNFPLIHTRCIIVINICLDYSSILQA